MSESMRIAVPVESGEGLEAVRSEHFGHSAAFAIVDVEDGAPVATGILPNPPHSQGGCMTTVNLLAANGVQAVSAVGMGRGPLNGLMQVGIAIHHDAASATVGEAIAAIIEGRTTPFGSDHACQGHH
ncbi:MAG: dinitrogenase iron-molybdenum cofactor biosynthesis protein [Actinobacteria bacterium HGW-Actinobacteria-7]|jgi:predicted Fe-Mo cluster-binding NifX family protein|nr:MAG: dinitrogenase iron-molybdenum cofactor biosynthesis protein [Actinobacteria bacterium HGW-Actinobacteria-7]